jgi:hypothetical protein
LPPPVPQPEPQQPAPQPEPEQPEPEPEPASTHPLDQKAFTLLNRYPGENSFVSFAETASPPGQQSSEGWVRAMAYSEGSAMSLDFVAVVGAANVYMLQSREPGNSNWLSYSGGDGDAAWISASEADSEMAMHVEFVPQLGLNRTYVMVNRGRGSAGNGSNVGDYISFCMQACSNGKWLSADYSISTAMPVQLVQVTTPEPELEPISEPESVGLDIVPAAGASTANYSIFKLTLPGDLSAFATPASTAANERKFKTACKQDIATIIP